jgi:toxin ParE1/3/4
MAKLEFRPEALQDLQRIWNYTFDTWSENQADKYHGALMTACQQVANNPASGKQYNHIEKGLYGFRAGRHVIFYRIASDGITIVRILHGQMDLKHRMEE